jgi:hypothetical protein
MIAVNFALSILGALTMVWWNAARKGEKFSIEIWVEENIEAIAFTVFGIAILTMVYMLQPMALENVKTLTGISLTDTSTGWFTFGALLYEGIRKVKRSKHA